MLSSFIAHTKNAINNNSYQLHFILKRDRSSLDLIVNAFTSLLIIVHITELLFVVKKQAICIKTWRGADAVPVYWINKKSER